MTWNPESPGTSASLRILVHTHQAGRSGAPTPQRLCLLTGRVTAQVGEERLEVAWGDEQYKSSPRAITERADQLSPFRTAEAQAEL
jgi:hypothetical protein